MERGAASIGQLGAANLIKPLLTNGKLRCIGSTTYQEYTQIFEKDTALARRFQKIDISEPSIEDTTKILIGLKSKYEEHHNVKYSLKALKLLLLYQKYINERQLPIKQLILLMKSVLYQDLKTKKSLICLHEIESMF